MSKKSTTTATMAGTASTTNGNNETAAQAIDRINGENPEEGIDEEYAAREDDVQAPTTADLPTLSEFAQQVKEYGPDFVWPLTASEIVVDFTRNGRNDVIKASDKDVKELAESIKELGQQSPGWVTLDADGKMYLDYGFRRMVAIQLINSTRHAADVLPFKAFVRLAASTPSNTRTEQLKRNFHENAKRRELNVLDNVLVVTKFLDGGLNQKQVAAATGWSTASVNNYVKIGKFSDTVKGYIRDGKLPAKAAIELTKYSTNEEADKAAEELVKDAEASGTGPVKTSAAKKKKKAAGGKASTNQLTMKEFIDGLDFLFAKTNAKQLHATTNEILRIVADFAQGRSTQEKTLEKLAAYK